MLQVKLCITVSTTLDIFTDNFNFVHISKIWPYQLRTRFSLRIVILSAIQLSDNKIMHVWRSQ